MEEENEENKQIPLVIFKVDFSEIKSEDHMILFRCLEGEALNVSNYFISSQENSSSSFNKALKLIKKA